MEVTVLLSLALSLSASAATWPAGATIDDAASLHLTKEGLAQTGALLPAMLPVEAMPVDAIEYSGGSGCFNYELSFADGWVGFAVDDATIIPGAGELVLQLDAHAWINDQSDPFSLYYELFCLGEECPGYVKPFPVTVDVPFALDVREGGFIDATMHDITYTHGLVSDDIELDCNVDTLEQVLSFFGWSLYDFIISIAETQIDSIIQDQKADLEAALEDGLNQARVDTTVDVAGIPLEIQLVPQDIWINPEGLELIYEGRLSAPEDGCVSDFDSGESTGGDSGPPPVSEDPPGTQAAILVSDDIANQGLYALWRGGLLCQELPGEDASSLPLPIDTTLLGLLAGDAFDEVFPETQPLIIRMVPRATPVVDYDAGHDLTVLITDLAVDLYAPVDFRMAHPLGLDVSADAGVDLAFDGATGELEVLLALAEEDIHAVASSNELVPDATDQIESSFGGALSGLLDALLGTLLSDTSFALPAMEGLGLTSLEVSAVAGAEDWMRVQASLGEVSYGSEGEGCSGTGGCSSTGGVGAWLLATLGALALRRRR